MKNVLNKSKILDKNDKLIESIKKTTILVGPNGIGKTLKINQLKKGEKIIINKGEEKDLKIYFAGEENVKDDVDSTKAKYKIDIEKLKKDINSFEGTKSYSTRTNNINNDLEKNLNEIKDKFKNNLEEEIISPQIKLKHTIEKDAKYKINSNFIFNNIKYEMKKLPTGVRKLIHLYFNTKIPDTSQSEKIILLLLDEIDSMLHPSWIKLVTGIIKTWIDNKNIYLVMSTHKPETLYQLNEHIEYLATPIKNNNDNIKIEYIDFKKILEDFNDINKTIIKKSGEFDFKEIDEKELISKIKVKFSFQFCRMFFSQSEEIILVEGIIDQMFFKNKTNKLVCSIFGIYQVGLYLATLKWIMNSNGWQGVSLILDGDGKLKDETSINCLLKTKLDQLGINNYFFEKNIEKSLFKIELSGKFETQKKFKYLEENYNHEIKNEEINKILK